MTNEEQLNDVVNGILNQHELNRFITKESIKMFVMIEGFELQVYKDTEGYLTVGLGHKLSKQEASRWPLDSKVPKNELYFLACQDINKAMAQAIQTWPELIHLENAPIRIIFAYMIFNVGLNGWKKFSKTIALGLEPILTDASAIKFLDELANSKWATQVPRALRIITNKLLFGKVSDKRIDVWQVSDNMRKLLLNSKYLSHYVCDRY